MQRQLTSHVSRLKSDAVFMFSLSEKLLLTDHILAQGGQVFWIEHDRIGPWLTRNPWLGQLRELSKKVTTVCVSELSRNMYISLGWPPEKVVAIPNGIDLQRFERSAMSDEMTHSLTAHSSQLVLGCVARLTRDKGVDVLINAMADLPQASLTIVGTGREEGLLRQMISSQEQRSPGFALQVRLVRSVPDLGAFYRSLDVLVLPSREHDPFGLVAAEAMSLGIAVIVTDACGIAGYLQDGKDAIVAPADDVSGLFKALKRLSDASARLPLAKEGQKTAINGFSLQRMVDEYRRLLTK